MHSNTFDQPEKTRYAERDDATTRIALPRQTTSRLFAGWGPKLMAAALAVGALNARTAASAADALPCLVPDHDAVLLSAPAPDVPAIAQLEGVGGDVVVRIDLSVDGSIENARVYQSSGSILIDREALRVTHLALFAPASAACRPIPRTVLLSVNFDV